MPGIVVSITVPPRPKAQEITLISQRRKYVPCPRPLSHLVRGRRVRMQVIHRPLLPHLHPISTELVQGLSSRITWWSFPRVDLPDPSVLHQTWGPPHDQQSINIAKWAPFPSAIFILIHPTLEQINFSNMPRVSCVTKSKHSHCLQHVQTQASI